jgi:hydrogenase maturation protease
VIIGIGTDTGGDDAAGLLVARHLRALGIEALDYSGEVLGLLDRWEGANSVILIDAMRSGRPVGSLVVLDARQAPWAGEQLHVSTHGLGLVEALALAKLVDRLPPRVVIYGIEGRNFSPGSQVSPEVLAAVEEVARRIAQEVSEYTNPA